jgi:hypothetical protein
MKKFEILIDTYKDKIDEFLLRLDGIKDVHIKEDKWKTDINILYNDKNISIIDIKDKLIEYVDAVNVPSILSFNKFEEKNINKEIFLGDGCCEYCMKGTIEELLEIDGINSASYEDGKDFFNVTLKLSYNPDKINNEKLEQIIKEL